MAWAVRQHTRSAVDKAGAMLVASEVVDTGFEKALDIINNWRSAHAFPLNTMQVRLRVKSKEIYADSLIAQRIKRLSSIDLKLRRFSSMKLSQMQDIGGCRAILKNVQQVESLVELYKKCDFKHKLDHIDDYIKLPQRSGYRGIHLIYRYHSDRNETYNGLKIEIQIRSQLQHAWATAVETVGTFIKQALKSSQGETEWLRFFTLMGSALAMRERTQLVVNTPSKRKELIEEVNHYAHHLDVYNRLEAYGNIITIANQPQASQSDAHYFLLVLDPGNQQVKVFGYKFKELPQATEHYLKIEKEITQKPGAEAVLVSVDTLATLRRAYPNYFLDTRLFLIAVKKFLG